MLRDIRETEAQQKRNPDVSELEACLELKGGLASGKGKDPPLSPIFQLPSFTVSEIIGRDLSGFPARPGEEPPA